MHSLPERFSETGQRRGFLLGIELVSTRGSMADRQAVEARAFATDLSRSQQVDWVSITDNAGGNPQLAPMALGRPILYAGKNVLIHLSCKDFNRNGIESRVFPSACRKEFARTSRASI